MLYCLARRPTMMVSSRVDRGLRQHREDDGISERKQACQPLSSFQKASSLSSAESGAGKSSLIVQVPRRSRRASHRP